MSSSRAADAAEAAALAAKSSAYIDGLEGAACKEASVSWRRSLLKRLCADDSGLLARIVKAAARRKENKKDVVSLERTSTCS